MRTDNKQPIRGEIQEVLEVEALRIFQARYGDYVLNSHARLQTMSRLIEAVKRMLAIYDGDEDGMGEGQDEDQSLSLVAAADDRYTGRVLQGAVNTLARKLRKGASRGSGEEDAESP